MPAPGQDDDLVAFDPVVAVAGRALAERRTRGVIYLGVVSNVAGLSERGASVRARSAVPLDAAL